MEQRGEEEAKTRLHGGGGDAGGGGGGGQPAGAAADQLPPRTAWCCTVDGAAQVSASGWPCHGDAFRLDAPYCGQPSRKRQRGPDQQQEDKPKACRHPHSAWLAAAHSVMQPLFANAALNGRTAAASVTPSSAPAASVRTIGACSSEWSDEEDEERGQEAEDDSAEEAIPPPSFPELLSTLEAISLRVSGGLSSSAPGQGAVRTVIEAADAHDDFAFLNSVITNMAGGGTAAGALLLKAFGGTYFVPPRCCFLLSDLCHVQRLVSGPATSFSLQQHGDAAQPAKLGGGGGGGVKRASVPLLSSRATKQGTADPTSAAHLGHAASAASTRPPCSLRRHRCIIMDPPWPSKSVARGKTYNTIAGGVAGLDSLMSLPVRELASETVPGCLVCVWVTNDPAISAFVLETLFPHWGVDHITEWFWVKVTSTEGDTVLPFESGSGSGSGSGGGANAGAGQKKGGGGGGGGRPHRHPFEVCIIGRLVGQCAKKKNSSDGSAPHHDHTAAAVAVDTCGHGDETANDSSGVHWDKVRLSQESPPVFVVEESMGSGQLQPQPQPHCKQPPSLPHHAVLLATPGCHSRKPQLQHLLRPFLDPPPQQDGPATALNHSGCPTFCELFARNLCADTTSWGNECLKHQEVSFFGAASK